MLLDALFREESVMYKLNILTACFFITLMLDCAQIMAQPPRLSFNNGVQTVNGPDTAAYLTTLYNRKFDNCNKLDSRPAFLCSGVTLRLTIKAPNNDYKAWEPSPTATAKDGVSFSYLRADTNFSHFGGIYQNGFFIYPVLETPADKRQLLYMCSYPMDGWTQSRTKLCGPHQDWPDHSNLCHTYAPDYDARAWVYVWTYPFGGDNKEAIRQCGFDVTDERDALSGPAFRESLRARELLAAKSPGYADKVFHDHNEIIIKAWPKGQPNALPILAFFYVNGFSDGLADARYNQRDYCNSTNPKILIPIIRLTPAVDLTGTTYFTYSAADQAGCG